ncbi:hypothetical protein PR202_ga31553 [Eleusine coracana subsp. coracana]|uniref:Peptidase S54 rhomboid domain-containing protein n=1 Tax=Eleusine coracana subsp. coracana TaxID=191504 RepID=A0AAV5DSA7_ELECO|nr:hypothetical protein PR202_ga31553 [Eleusine coracana subsp. coracana]
MPSLQVKRDEVHEKKKAKRDENSKATVRRGPPRSSHGVVAAAPPLFLPLASSAAPAGLLLWPWRRGGGDGGDWKPNVIAAVAGAHLGRTLRRRFVGLLCSPLISYILSAKGRYLAQVATQGKLLMWGAKFNCFSLNSMGPTVEMLTGPKRFLAVYFTSALAGSLMSYRYCEFPAVGASGAIFGLVGAYAVYMWRHKRFLGNGKESLEHIGRVVVLNMGMGLLSRGIDNWAHALKVKVLASSERLIQGLFLANDEEHLYDQELVKTLEKDVLGE